MAETPAAPYPPAPQAPALQQTKRVPGVLMLLSFAMAGLGLAQENPSVPPNPPPAVPPPAGEGKAIPPRPMPPPMRRQGLPPPGGPGMPGSPGSGPGMPGGPGPGPGNGPGDRGFPRSGSTMSPLQTEGFERLPEEEKKRVRAAMEKAWSMPALQQAKERYLKANEEFRTAMRQALEEVDPEVVKILEKMKPQQQMDPRAMPKLPPPTDDQFAKIAVERLGMEIIGFARPELRGRIRAAHGKVMQQPDVAEAVKHLLAAPPEARADELRKLREVYRKAMAAELPNMGRSQQGQGAASADAAPSPGANPPDFVPEPKKQQQ